MIKKKMKKSRGITLIALIITVIVLIILAAVAVDVAVDGKLFDKSRDAVSKQNNKIEAEQHEIDELTNEIVTSEKEEEKTNQEIELILSYSSKLPKWTNQNVVVTASANINDNYIIEMKKNNEAYNEGVSVTFDANGDVYARVKEKSSGEIVAQVQGKVENIDKNPPTIGKMFDGTSYLSYDVENIYASSVTLSIEDGSDLESGHKSTTYAIYNSWDGFNSIEEIYNSMEWEMDFDPYNLTSDVNISWLSGPILCSTLLEERMIYANSKKIRYNVYEKLIRPVAAMGSGDVELYIEVKTIDNAGNQVSNRYDIIIKYK